MSVHPEDREKVKCYWQSLRCGTCTSSEGLFRNGVAPRKTAFCLYYLLLTENRQQSAGGDLSGWRWLELVVYIIVSMNVYIYIYIYIYIYHNLCV